MLNYKAGKTMLMETSTHNVAINKDSTGLEVSTTMVQKIVAGNSFVVVRLQPIGMIIIGQIMKMRLTNHFSSCAKPTITSVVLLVITTMVLKIDAGDSNAVIQQTNTHKIVK